MTPDVHAPYLAALETQGDWAALVRYWIAHGPHQPAFDAALRVVRTRSGEPWGTLAGYLTEVGENPVEPREPPKALRAARWTPEQAASLNLVAIFPMMALCESAGQYPLEHQDKLFDVGKKAATQATELATACGDPALAAFAHMLIASAFQQRGQLEAAEGSYRQALREYCRLAQTRPNVYRPAVALTLNNLGIVQRNLNQLEEAAGSYQEALGEYRRLADVQPDVYLHHVAATLNNLGNVQWNLNRLEDAEGSFREALTNRRRLAEADPDTYLPYVAMTLNNLGNVQAALNRPADAETSYWEALLKYRRLAEGRPDEYRPYLATLLNNLGTLQNGLNRPADAEGSYREALGIYRRLAEGRLDVYLPEIAVTLNNLGNVQRGLNRLEDAAVSYQEAADIYEQHPDLFGTSQLMERFRLYRNYADLVLRDEPAQGWPDRARTRELLRHAADCAEQFRGMFGDPRERIRVQDEFLGVYARRVRVCLEIGHLFNDPTAFWEAVEAAEASRSRALLDSLAPVLAPAAAPFELREQFTQLRNELRRAQRRAHQEYETLQALLQQKAAPPEPPPSADDDEPDEPTVVQGGTHVRRLRNPLTLTTELNTVRDQNERLTRLGAYIGERLPRYQQVCAALAAVDPAFNPDAAVNSFRRADLAELFPADVRTVYAHLHLVGDECHAVVIARDGCHPVKLGITSTKLFADINTLAAAQHVPDTGVMIAAMQASLAAVLDTLRTGFVGPLLPALTAAGLTRGDRLVFVPDGAMNFLPLHAVPVDHETLADRYEVGYAPSLSVLLQCVRRKYPEPTELFAAVNPLGDLPFTNVEARLVQERFASPEVLNGKKVTHDAFLKGAAASHVCYWSGHARFSIGVPHWSGLVFRQSGEAEVTAPHGVKQKRPAMAVPDDLVTYTDIDCGLAMWECWLAVLSGCQSGLALPGVGNEHVSLVGAFLNAGAKCVLASLWPVEDAACMLTVDRFFHEWREQGKGIAAALKAAQQWLRALTVEELDEYADELAARKFEDRYVAKLRRLAHWHRIQGTLPFASPYYWAPFVAVGQTWQGA